MAERLTVGKIVEYDAADKTYRCHPSTRHRLPGRRDGNLAVMLQFESLMGAVEDDIVECFRHGGGVPYAKYPTFQKLMAEMSADIHDAALFDGTLPLVDGIIDRLERGIDVCDVGCGEGHAINLMAKGYPKSRFTGWDFSEEGVAAARKEAAELGVTNATFEVKDAATIDGHSSSTSSRLRRHPRPGAAAPCSRASPTRSARTAFLCVDIAGSSNVEENMEHPLAPLLYSVSTFHCMTVSLALDGAGLGTMWGEQKANEMFREAGFTTWRRRSSPRTSSTSTTCAGRADARAR